MTTPSSHEITHPTVWNRDVSFKAWKMYLGDDYRERQRVAVRGASARNRPELACHRRWSQSARLTCSAMRISITPND